MSEEAIREVSPTPAAPKGLRGRAFEAFFRCDSAPEPVPFTIGGNEAQITFQKMSKKNRDEFLRLGGSFGEGGDGNVMKALNFMVGASVSDYRLWKRSLLKDGDGQPGPWLEVRPQPNAKPEQVAQAIREILDEAGADIWDDVLIEANRANGFGGANEPPN